jgi:hypothetical protein
MPPRARRARHVAAGIAGAAEGLAQGLRESRLAEATGDALHEGGRLAKAVTRSPRRANRAIDRRVRHAQATVRRVARRTEEGVAAVVETADRALQAPPRIAEDLKEAGGAYLGGLAKSAAFYVAAGAIGIAAFIVLTIGFVTGLDLLLGQPWGAFIVALAYGLAALAVALLARGAMHRGQQVASHRIQSAKQEARAVVQPLRQLRSRPARPAHRPR